jgi:hypothetical protein
MLVIGSSVGNVLPLPFSVPILVTRVGGELFSILWDVWHQHFSMWNVIPARLPVAQPGVQRECRKLGS